MSGRKFLVALSIGVVLVFSLALKFFGEKAVWGALDIPTQHPAFIDLRGVLTGLDAARLGFDPIHENPLDPYKRPVVYPRLWLALGWFGLSEKHTEILAFGLLAVYAISILLALKNYDRFTSVMMAFVIFSPAAWMCYKFANLDLVIFILIALMLTVEKSSLFLALGLLELAAVLKFFPIAALGFLLKEERKRFLRLAAIVMGIFAVYLMLTWKDASWILGHAPKGALENYGVEVIGFRINEITGSRSATNLVTVPLFMAAYLVMMAALYFSSRYKIAATDQRFLDAFRIGALIYLATFVQGNSFNYRFIFTVFAVPQMVLWARAQSGIRLPAISTLVFLVLSCWGMSLITLMPVNIAFAVDEIFNWLLFAGLFFLFFVSAPGWIKNEIVAFFRRYRLKKAVG